MKGMMKGFGSMFKSETRFQKRVARYAKETRASPADVIAWAGCKDSERSDDIVEDGETIGAMSKSTEILCFSLEVYLCLVEGHAFVEVLRKQPQQSYQELLNNIRDVLQEKYNQKPQLTSSHPIVSSNFAA
jgi:hypothetical protein